MQDSESELEYADIISNQVLPWRYSLIRRVRNWLK